MPERKEKQITVVRGNKAEFRFYDYSFRAPHVAAHFNLDGSLGIATINNRRFYKMSVNPTEGHYNLFRLGSISHMYLGEITSEIQRFELRTAVYSSEPKDMRGYTYQRAGILHIIEDVNHGKSYRHFRIPSFLNLQNLDEIQKILSETPFGKIRERKLHLPY